MPGLLPHVYRAMPWHDQRLYREMLAEQLTAEREERERAERDSTSSGASGSGTHTVTTAAHGDLSGSGFQIRQIQAGPDEAPRR